MMYIKTVRYFFSFLLKIAREENATVLPFAALAFPVVLGMAGLGTDASLWVSNKRILQAAADSAVVAAGWEAAMESVNYMDEAALREAETNGYRPERNGELRLEILEQNPDGSMILGLTLTQDADAYFSRIVYSDTMRMSAYAQASVDGVSGRFCILSLDEDDPATLSNSGSVIVNMPDCGIAVNSRNRRALNMDGSADVTVGTARVSGYYDIGSNVDFHYDSLRTGTPAVKDPYAELEPPAHDRCGNRKGTKINASTTLSPGVYCGGLDISGTNDIVFQPGVYYIDGGSFKVTGGGSLFGEGVTFVLTGENNNYAQIDISGGRNINFSAPAEGAPMEGIVFFQDRDAPDQDHLQNKLTGTSQILINGAMYFPSQGLWFGGDGEAYSGDTPCTKMIARTVTLAGNPILGNNCRDVAVRPLGPPEVRLIR